MLLLCCQSVNRAVTMKAVSETEIREAIETFLSGTMGVQVKPGESFAGMGVDSMAILKILFFLERELDISIPDSALTSENIYSIQTLAAAAYQVSTTSS